MPECFTGDPHRLRQILINLVGNAIKFTDQGEVSVRVEKESETESEVSLHFQVRDTGIGIAAEKQAPIFEAFARADGSTTRKYGGTGLGLAIASQIVDLMGGRIWLESPSPTAQPDEDRPGTVFHFSVSLGIARGIAKASPLNFSELCGVRVLAVDDNATNRQILQETLNYWKMTPTTVDSGLAALAEMKRAVEVQEPFGLVLLDAHMPNMDGFEVVERIKQTSEFAGTPIMMLSSADQTSQLSRCRELGLDLYLIKPIGRSELLSAIRAVLGTRTPNSVEVEVKTNPKSDGSGRSFRILLAEDNPINQRLAVRILEKRGHTVELATNGREAVETFTRQSFDLVLMDVQMPEVNGFEATAAIRRRELAAGVHTPIIAMTAYAMACISGEAIYP